MYLRILHGSRMYDKACVEGSPESVIGKLNSTVNKLWDTRGRNRCLGNERTERLGGEAYLLLVVRV